MHREVTDQTAAYLKRSMKSRKIPGSKTAYPGRQNRYADGGLLEKYRFLFDAAPVGIGIADFEDNLLDANRSLQEMLGFTLDELRAIGIGVIYANPDDRKLLLEKLQETDRVCDLEVRLKRKDGTIISVLLNMDLLEFGGQKAVIATARDITERKKVEEELRARERFLESIFSSIQDGIGIIDMNMNILRINKTAEQWYPHAAPFVGKKCYEAYHGRSERCEKCPAWRTLKTGSSAYEIVPKHGPGGKEIGWVEIYTFPMIDSATGQMRGVIEYVRDITERKKSEESLKIFSEAVGGALDGIQIVDLDGYVTYSNRAVEEIYGFSSEELRGKHINEMNADKEFASGVIIPSIKKTGRWVGELLVRRKDGREFPIWLTASVVNNSRGEPIAMVGIIRDITERKKAEEAIKRYAGRLEEANRMKMLFTDIMHHDLLNPLSIASSYAELLKDGEADQQKKAYLDAIGRNLTRGMELIENATMFSKLESLESIKFEMLDLKEVVERAVESLSPLASEAGMKIENRLVQSMPARGNKIIEEVFANFLSNAIKYASSGERVIVEGEEAGEYWSIRVVDFGEGIDDADKTRIFERFLRMEKKGVKGSGLGLAIAGKIMQLHGGRIRVEDNPEGGAVFVAEVPKYLK